MGDKNIAIINVVWIIVFMIWTLPPHCYSVQNNLLVPVQSVAT